MTCKYSENKIYAVHLMVIYLFIVLKIGFSWSHFIVDTEEKK